jgi:hypothetical protein
MIKYWILVLTLVLTPMLVAASESSSRGDFSGNCGSWSLDLNAERQLTAGTCCYCNYKSVPCHCGHVSGYKTCPCDNQCTTGYRPEDEHALDGLKFVFVGRLIDVSNEVRVPAAGMPITFHFNGSEILRVVAGKDGDFIAMVNGPGTTTDAEAKMINVGDLIAHRAELPSYAIVISRSVSP